MLEQLAGYGGVGATLERCLPSGAGWMGGRSHPRDGWYHKSWRVFVLLSAMVGGREREMALATLLFLTSPEDPALQLTF